MKSQITIAKPDATRSCVWCRLGALPALPEGGYGINCVRFDKEVQPSAAQTCPLYRDTRRTSQVISAGGKVFD